MKKMRKVCALLLVVVMALSMLPALSFAAEPQEITIDGWNSSMENFEGRTVLLICPKLNGAESQAFFDTTLVWRVTFTWDGGSKTIDANISSNYLTTIVRLAICEGEGDNKFVPEKGKTYKVGAEVYDSNGNKKYYASNTINATLNVDPIDPDDAWSSISPECSPTPLWGKIENWSGQTFFIVGLNSGNDNLLISSCAKGEAEMKVVIADMTAGKVYTIDKYQWSMPGLENGGSFIRIAPCFYGIVPEVGHEYTVALVFTRNGEVISQGVSDMGIFKEGNDGFKADGAIIPATVPYTHTEGPMAVDLGKYGSGWENWSNQTQLLLMPKWNGKNFSLFGNAGLVWELTFVDENGADKTVTLNHSSTGVAGSLIVRFQTCLGTNGNWFIPESGKSYTVTAKVKSGNTVLFESKNALETTFPDYEPVISNKPIDYLTVNKTEEKGNSVSFVGALKDTIGQKYVGTLNGLTLTATFKQNGETVKTFVSETSAVYATLIGVASADATTAAAQGVSYIDASYLFGMTVSGIPAGSYTVELTAEGMNAEGTVITAANTVTVTVA